jgi:hypothetical protein
MPVVCPRAACVEALQFTGSVACALAIAATWPATCRVVPGGLECSGRRVEVGAWVVAGQGVSATEFSREWTIVEAKG